MMGFWHYLAVLVAVVAALAFLSQLPQTTQSGFAVFSAAELAANGTAIGPENAKVVIIEFSDYQCPACLVAEQGVKETLKEFDGKVRFVYKNFPLYSIHPQAGIAAEAALAAREQGKFWEMHGKLFEKQEQIRAQGIVAVKAIAIELGLDEEKFNAALDSHKFAPAVKKDFDDALRFKLQGTPTFFINGKQYFSALSAGQLKQIIDLELLK